MRKAQKRPATVPAQEILTEEWRPMPWSPKHQASSIGRIRKIINRDHPERRQEIYMRFDNDKDGYLKISIKNRRWMVHRIIYLLFVGPLEDGLVVCHIDGEKTNNKPDNLYQGTQKENIAHKVYHGTAQEGEKHGRASLTNSVARDIIEEIKSAGRHKSGRLLHGERARISEKYGISKHIFYDLSIGRSWGCVR